MSIVIEYYPEKATKADLTEFFLSENFNRCNYFLDPFPRGSIYLNWFDSNEYKSLDGLEAVIFPNKEKSIKGWGVYTRTRVWASAFDKQKQNEIIRKARKLFGGDFYNDSQGKNRFIKIEKSEFLTPSESGVFLVYEKVKSQLSKLSVAITDHKEQDHYENIENIHHDIANLIKENRPSLALYNSLVPFLVSALEHFFKELFIVLVEFDNYGKEEIQKIKLKDSREFNTVEDIINVRNGQVKLEREIAKGYNFQNLDKINSTFKIFLKIDIKSILSVRKKVINRNIFIYKELADLIERRHWIIHSFGFSTDTDKDKYIHFLNLTNCVIDLVAEYLERERGYRFLNNSIYYRSKL